MGRGWCRRHLTSRCLSVFNSASVPSVPLGHMGSYSLPVPPAGFWTSLSLSLSASFCLFLCNPPPCPSQGSSKETLQFISFSLSMILGSILISSCICAVETGPEDTKIVFESFLRVAKQNDSYFLGTHEDRPGNQQFLGLPPSNQSSYVPILYRKCNTCI